MVEGALVQDRDHACAPRNHLPQLIHPGPGSVEKRADSAPQVQAADNVAHDTRGLTDSPEVRSSMPSRSGRGPQILKTALFPVIGRGDLLSGSRNSHIATPGERHSRFTMLIKVPSKDT